ncbi:MAG: hypothetical protein A2X81_00365 [Desulfobacterales bacterium GWB2_56_26]|nr:MAG: hypothetical protein A2X81_00365 [Desulfobacterales bacterium GWB2_56_26]
MPSAKILFKSCDLTGYLSEFQFAYPGSLPILYGEVGNYVEGTEPEYRFKLVVFFKVTPSGFL